LAKINILILLLNCSNGETNEAVHFGKMTHYIPENNVYVYFRYTDNKTVMILMNNSNEIQTIKTARFQESVKAYTTGKDILSDFSTFLKKLSWNQSQLSF
jgi:hypothetical protein